MGDLKKRQRKTHPPQKLTLRAIRSFRYEGDGSSRDVRWDTEIKSFGIRIYPSGRKTFVLKYRPLGSRATRVATLGALGDITLAQARAKAGILRGTIKQGSDPLVEKEKAKQGETWADLKKKYLEEHAKPRKKTWPEDERRLRQTIPSKWNNRKVANIRRPDVKNLHTKIGASAPYEANRVLALLHKMFKLAKEWGFVEENAANPAAGIDRFKEQKRKRFVTVEEVKKLAKAIDSHPSIYIRSALWLYLLTACRKTELLQAERAHISEKPAVLHLPDTKSGEPQDVPLSAVALAIIQAIPPVEDNPYLLPGRRKGQHLVNISKPWRAIRKQAGLDDVRLHDLRRSVGSWMTQMGIDLNVIKEGLRHADLATTLVYARLGDDPAREAFEEHGRRMIEVIGGPKVVATSGDKA